MTVTLSRRTPGPIISALRPNKNQSQSPSRRRPQGEVRAPARQTQQKRSHPSQPGKQRIVSKGKEEPQLSSGQWQGQRGKEGPTTQSLTPSTRLQLQPKSFWHYLFGALRETREKEKRGTTALHAAEIPKSQKDGPLLWQQPGGGSVAGLQAHWRVSTGKEGALRLLTALKGSHRDTRTYGQTGSQLAPGGW